MRGRLVCGGIFGSVPVKQGQIAKNISLPAIRFGSLVHKSNAKVVRLGKLQPPAVSGLKQCLVYVLVNSAPRIRIKPKDVTGRRHRLYADGRNSQLSKHTSECCNETIEIVVPDRERPPQSAEELVPRNKGPGARGKLEEKGKREGLKRSGAFRSNENSLIWSNRQFSNEHPIEPQIAARPRPRENLEIALTQCVLSASGRQCDRSRAAGTAAATDA